MLILSTFSAPALTQGPSWGASSASDSTPEDDGAAGASSASPPDRVLQAHRKAHAFSATGDVAATNARDFACTAAQGNLKTAHTAVAGEEGEAEGTLAPWPTRPRYWQYNGQPKLLLGGSVRDSMFQLSKFVLRSELDTMVAAGGNYLRNTMSDRKSGSVGDRKGSAGDAVYAFKQVSGGKYDLNQWNDAYWNHFSTMLQETAQRGVFVQIELWDVWDFISNEPEENQLPTGNPRWYAHPWNPRNNINYTIIDTKLPETWGTPMGNQSESTIHPIMKTVPGLNNDTVVLPYQEAFIAKVLSYTLQYDHVLYQVANEHWGNILWSNYWAEFIHKRAAQKGKTVYVTESRHTPTVAPVQDYPHLYNFADISQSALKSGEAHMTVIRQSFDQTEATPLPLNSTKQYGADTSTWGGSSNEAVDRFVRSVFGGQGAVRFHRPPAGLGISPLAQKVIKSLRMMECEIGLFNNVLPHSVSSIRELLGFRSDNEAYIMADPGRAYAVYFPNGGSVTLNTSAVTGSMTRKWMDVTDATWGPTAIVNGALQTLTAPSGKWIVVVRANQ